MGKQINRYLISGILTVLLMAGCADVAYEYDIQSGFDDHTADQENVTVDMFSGIDVSMYDYARIFPGLVDTLTENRISETTIYIDLSLPYNTASTLNVQHVPQPIYSTGLYAGAGELVTIDIEGNVNGLTVQIGSHMDDLTTNSTFTRQPLVYTRKALYQGRNTIRNPLGGYIWIFRSPSVTGSAQQAITFSGVYRAPDFVRDQDNSAWEQQLNETTVPWFELRGKHVAFSVSRTRMLEKMSEDPSLAAKLNDILTAWDYYIETFYYNFYGLTVGDPVNKFRAPDFPERVVLDVELLNKVYMRWSGQPIVAMNTAYMLNELVDAQKLRTGNSTALCTAFANNYLLARNSPWWSDVIASAAALPIYRISEKAYSEGLSDTFCPVFVGEGQDVNDHFARAVQYAAADSAKFLGKDAETNFEAYRLLSLVQLAYAEKDGTPNNWKLYEDMFKSLKEVSGFRREGLAFFAPYVSEYFGKSFSPYFDHWGIYLPDALRKQIDDAYPLLDKTYWCYDPLAADPAANVVPYDNSNYYFRHVRSGWEVTSVNRDYIPAWDNAYIPEYLIDNNRETSWHVASVEASSNADFWSTPPNYLIIDMQTTNTVNGVYFAQNPNEESRTPRRMIIQTTDETDFDLGDVEVVWRDVAEIRQFWEAVQPGDNMKTTGGIAPDVKNEQFFEFNTPVNCRYLRVKFPEMQYQYKDWSYAKWGLLEPGDEEYDENLFTSETWENNSVRPRIRISEFGTFYK